MADESPITGWEPGLDVGDSLLRREVHNLAARFRFCAERAGVPSVDEPDVVGVHLAEGAIWGNDLLLLRPFEEAEVDALLDRLAELAPWDSVLWSPWPGPDLSRHGLSRIGHPPWMLRAPGGDLPAPPEGVRIVEVDDDAGMADYDRTVIDGFPLRRTDGTLLETVLHPGMRGGPWRFFVAYLEDEPVSVASAFVAAGIVQVEWVATLPEARGRGIGEAVTWRATLAEPGLPATLVASDMGRPVYERMGFLPVQRLTVWHWKGRKGEPDEKGEPD